MSKPTLVHASPDTGELARQIKDQFDKAVGGMVDFIALGALGLRLREAIVSTRGQVATGGKDAKGTGIKGWLESNHLDYTRQTLYRAMEAAENIAAEFKLGPKADLYDILKGKKPEPKQLALREKINAFVAGKSKRQLLISVGTPDATIGGKRPKKDAPPTEQERREAWLSDAVQRADSTFAGLHDLGERWKTLDDAKLKVAIEDAKTFAREAEAYLKTPAPNRAGVRVEQYLAEIDAANTGDQKA